MIEYELRAFCRGYADLPAGARIVAINGRAVFARCVVCEGWLFEDTMETAAMGYDGEYYCRACWEKVRIEALAAEAGLDRQGRQADGKGEKT